MPTFLSPEIVLVIDNISVINTPVKGHNNMETKRLVTSQGREVVINLYQNYNNSENFSRGPISIWFDNK